MNIENRIKIKILKVSYFTSPPSSKPKLRYKENKKVNDWSVIAICSPYTQFMSLLTSSPAHGKQEGYRSFPTESLMKIKDPRITEMLKTERNLQDHLVLLMRSPKVNNYMQLMVNPASSYKKENNHCQSADSTLPTC